MPVLRPVRTGGPVEVNECTVKRTWGWCRGKRLRLVGRERLQQVLDESR